MINGNSKEYINGLKKEIRRVKILLSKTEDIKAESEANSNLIVSALNTNIKIYQKKINRLNKELKKATGVSYDTRKIVNEINSDTFKGCVYEICKILPKTFEVSDIYVFGESLAVKYPNFDRNSIFGDNINNGIRSCVDQLSNQDGLLERLGYNSYRVRR
jgi:uncharacterized small protein (DUF1192 family)